MACASEYVQTIGRMLYDEPCVHNGVIVYTHSEAHAIQGAWAY